MNKNYNGYVRIFAHGIKYRPSNIVPKAKSNMSKLKILLGPSEISNNLYTMATALKKHGYDATCIEYYKKTFDYQTDRFYNLTHYKKSQLIQKTKAIAKSLIPLYHMFHFMYGRTLATDHSDLEILKKSGKRVLMQHNGGDVRLYSEALKISPYNSLIRDDYYGAKKLLDEDAIKRHLEKLSKYIEDCTVMDYELHHYVKDYYKNIHILMKLIDLNNYKIDFGKPKKNRLTILHAPSNPIGKGTKYILKAIEELTPYYDFEFILVKNLPHEKAKELYKQGDIMIDQIINGSYGTFALEGMALGKPVICYISDFMKERYPKELPILSANPDNIKEKIEMLIKDRDLIEELGKKGRAYAEQYHDADKQVIKLVDIYKKINVNQS